MPRKADLKTWSPAEDLPWWCPIEVIREIRKIRARDRIRLKERST